MLSSISIVIISIVIVPSFSSECLLGIYSVLCLCVRGQVRFIQAVFSVIFLDQSMDKLQLTGRALGQVFNFRSGCCVHTMHLLPGAAIQPNLELKTRPKLVLGSLPLAFALPDQSKAGRDIKKIKCNSGFLHSGLERVVPVSQIITVPLQFCSMR